MSHDWNDEDKMRKAVYESLARSYAGGKPRVKHMAHIEEVTTELFQNDWFKALSTEEVTKLSTTEGWDWERFLDQDFEPGTTARDLVAYELDVSLDYFFDELGEIAAHDVFEGTEHLAANLRFFHTLASTYDFDLREVYEHLRDVQRRGLQQKQAAT